MRWIWILLSAHVLLACGLVPVQTVQREKPVATLDVPFKARSDSDAPLRRRVMVLPIVNESFLKAPQSIQAVRGAFLRTLALSDMFVLVSPDDFPQLDSYRRGEGFDLEGMARSANGLGIAALVEVKINDIHTRRKGNSVGLFRRVETETEAHLSVRMLATKSSKMLLTQSSSATIDSSSTKFNQQRTQAQNMGEDPIMVEMATIAAIEKIAQPILSAITKIQWQGRVALVQGDRVYINAGRLSGLQVGDILKVSEESQELFDPETGGFLGEVPGRMKGTVEVISYFGKDGAVGLVHSGSGFQENDRIELY